MSIDLWCKLSNRHDRRLMAEDVERTGEETLRITLRCAHDSRTDTMNIALPKWDPEDPPPDPPPEEPKPDPKLRSVVRTDFLTMYAMGDAPWGLNYRSGGRVLNTTSQYPNLPKMEREAMRKSLKKRGYTHIVVTARENGDLGRKHDFYKDPDKLTKALKELLADGIQPLLFLSVDDDPYIAGLSTEARIKLFLGGLKHWAPYCSSVCPSIEWDEWGTKEALRALVKAIKKKHPELFVWVHYLADWTENIDQGWGWATMCREADGWLAQQPWGKAVDPRKPHGEQRRRTEGEMESWCYGLTKRCQNIGIIFNHFEYAQDGHATEAVTRRLGNAGCKGMLRAGYKRERIGWGQAVSKEYTR